DDIISIGGDEVTISDNIPSVTVPAENAAQGTTTNENTTTTTTSSESLKTAHDRYLAAYQKYTTLVTNSGGADPAQIKEALDAYRSAYNEYQNLKMSGSK
ncbi:MAG: hypothetical protein ACOYXC_01880, partial [Candidatus Rifleibacteriota bacterium]